MNECLIDNGGRDVICKNTEGSFYCGCKTAGYVISKNGFSCEDHNECVTGIDNCDQQCINTEGSYNCFYEAGYALDTNGTSCSGEDKLYPGKIVLYVYQLFSICMTLGDNWIMTQLINQYAPARYLSLECEIWFISYSLATQLCGHFHTRYLLLLQT